MSKVPVNLQFELALLWRTLNIIKNIDGLSVVDFYEKFLPTLKTMPNLSLSTYWEEVSNYLASQNADQYTFKSIVGVPTIPVVSQDGNTSDAKKSANNLMSIPELNYLKFDERIDHKHDPLQVIHNLYGVAAAYTVDASPYNQSVLMSACLAVAVKSGRASLLLHVASMISTVILNSCDPEAPYISIDLDPLKDILNLLTQQAQPAVALHIKSNEHGTDAEQESEVVRYEKDPLLSRGALEDRMCGDSLGSNRKGMVLSFGKADHGKLGHGDVQLHRLVPTLIESLQDVEIRKTASMSTYSVAIDTEGAVYVWGTGGPAGAVQSSKTDIQPQLLEALPLHAKVIDVSCGLGHALFLLHTGRVYSWGNGGNGRLGLGDGQDRSEACPVVLLQHERIAAVQCGASHSMALTSSGKVYSWGKNTQGQCGHGNIDDHIKPTLIRKLEEHVIIQLAAGWEHSLALTQEGTIYSWGSGYKDNRRGVVPPVLGLGHNEVRQSPELIASIESVKIIHIACGWDHCLAVDEHGKVLAWGSGQNGKLGLGTEENVSLPCYIPTLDSDDECNNPKDTKKDTLGAKNEPKKRLFVTHMSAGCEHTAVLTRDGEVYSWGHGDGGRLGHGTNAQCLVPTRVESIALMGVRPTSVHCGDKFTMILANAPETTSTAATSVLTRHISLNAPVEPTTDTNNAYFSETRTFLQENLREADLAQMQHKLNLQTLESTQILKSLLVLMASAALPRADTSTPTQGTDLNVPEIMSLVSRFTALSAPKNAHTNSASLEENELLLRGFDREYSVECADSTYTNLLQLLDALMVPFQLSLSTFVSHGDRSSNVISAQISSLSLQSVAENVFSTSMKDMLHGNNNNSVEDNNQNSNTASFRTASVANAESVGQDAQKIVDQFESLYSLLVILAANVNVLAERCEGLKKSAKGKMDDSFHVRAKDWRNIQRELGRLMPISFEENLNTGRSAQSERSEQSRQRRRRSTGTGQDDPDPDDEDPDDFHADADAECSLGSMESEEHLLQSMVRQHQHQLGRRELSHSGDGDSRHPDHSNHHRHQQDQQSDDDDHDHRDFHDENSASAYEGEERDFGADSGDDSFFSGDRSRMRVGTDYDTSFGADEDRTFHGGDMSPLSNAHSHLAPAVVSSARGRHHQSDRVGDSSVESSRGGDWERDRDTDRAPYGSRSGSPAQSLDSLTHPRHDDPFDRTHSREQEEGYLTENSYSDSQDSRYGRRGGGSKPRGGAAGHHHRDDEEDDDGDMERYYEEQALGMENLDLQRAIISSMQENSSDMPYETVAYRGTALMYDCTPGRFGEGIGLSAAESQPAIPRIRDVLNSLASRCFEAVDTLSRQGTMKDGKNFKSEESIKSGNGINIAQNPTENTAVQSVYLLWEAVQVVTNTGFEVLYTAQDQKAVLCQLVRSPAQFLFILPGVVNGASRHNTLHASLNALFLPNEALFTVNDATNGMLVSEDSLDLRSILAFLNYVNLYIRAGNDILSKTSKTASRHGSSANLTAPVKNDSASANSVDMVAVKMHSSISAGLITLTKYLLHVLLDRIEASGAFLNDTIGLQPEQPWGTDMSKVLEIVADCVASDIEILTNRIDTFDDAAEPRFVASFTATVVGFLYSRVMARPSVINTVALLPTSMRLLRLFQATYDSFKRPVESKERFNAWLMGSFQWVVYHITGAVNVILHPSSALTPPPLRPASQACKELLSATEVRRHLLDANSNNSPYSWEQHAWSVLHRADPMMSRNSSTLSASDNVTAADRLRLADTRAKLLIGADVGLLVLNAIVGEAIPVGELCKTALNAKKSTFVEGALGELMRFFATPASQFQEKWKRGEECLWSTLSSTVQVYVSLLHTLCVSAGLNLANLVETVAQASKVTDPDRQNVLTLLLSSPDLATFVSLMLTSLTVVVASIECTAEVAHIVNKTAFFKNVAAQSKLLAASGYVLTGVTASSLMVPLVAVKEAVAESVNNAANSDKWHILVQSYVLPAKQAIKTALLASKFWLDAAVHTQLALNVKPMQSVGIEPAHLSSSQHTMPSQLAVFLLTKNLSLNATAQLALWEDDSLKNQQYALSLLVYLSDCLQHCPEVMHYCAESLQSFGDPLEALENLHFALSNSPAHAHSSRNDRSNSSSPTRSSSNYKVEQLLSKLDAQLVAKMTSLPGHAVVSSRKEEIKRMLSGFGQPTLKQVPDLLTFLRHGMITNAQFGLDSQGVAENTAAAVAAVSLNPFSTALKKTADVITALLASHQAEQNALSLQDVLCANKYINLLQATLGGLASMQGIDAQQKAHSAAQPARSSGIPGQDKAHDKSAYLHALCGVLNPLGSLIKVLVNCFQKHLLFCQAVGVQFLFPSIKAVEHSSPTLLSNVFTPQGNYSLGFWLYLPPVEVLLSDLKTVHHNGPQVHRIHLLSRVYETGEVNILSLLGNDITEAASSFSLSVHVIVEDSPSKAADPASATTKSVYLEVTVAATDFTSSTRENLNISANARSRAVKKVSIRSKPLESLEWISCVIELVQDSVAQSAEASAAVQNAVGGAAKAQARRNYKTKYIDTTCVALFVNNSLQSATTLSAGRSTLYQSMIIGKIPRKLGIAAGEKEQIFLTDVFWVPTSVYLSSAGSEYAKMRAFLTKLGSEGLIYTPNADSEFVSNDRNDYYRNFLPVSPPSLLLETIDSAFHCASQLLELLKAHLKAVPVGSVATSGVSVGANVTAVSSHRPTDGYTGNTLPLNLIPIVCSFAMDVVCIADARAQESAFQTLAALLESFPPTVTPSESGSTMDLSKSPAGSAFNAAVQNKASLAVKQAIVFCLGLLNDFFHTHHSAKNDVFELSFLTESPYALKPSSNREIWQKRLQLGRISIERSLRISEWGIRITIDENLIASGVASLLALAVRNGLGDAKFQHDCGLFAMLVAGGGWAPTVSVGRTAQLTPRKLFLHSDARAYEQCAFPTTAYVAGGTPNRPGVWLGQCLGAYQRIDAVPGLMPLVPRTLRAAILSTEMIPTRDPFAVLTMPQLNTVLKNYSLKSADELIAILKAMVTPTAGEVDKTGLIRNKPNHARALITQFESVALNDATNAEETKSTDEAQAAVREKDHFYLDLMQEMAFLRLLTVQLTHAAQANQKTRTATEESALRSQLDTLRNTVLKNLDKLLSIAVQDPVQAVSVIFSAGTFKGVQLDVLKNLLKEGDISFLERISLRLWKQYKLDINPSCESGFGTAAANTSLIQIASLAGEVVISETKIRAQTHFPTVRLLGVSIQRMTGRWFYECTLLSDGLIQLGWANSMFRCDPICGQGVGDHNHSWAFDGLRCKKWNVSCEPYGRRWKLGDTVGTLIDMDLLEIRFYLNGEDLGQAFEDFSSHDVFPALSLNLRQCVRLNFGQYKFLHPPDEMDGKPFRPVIAALQLQKAATGLVKPNPISPLKKAVASPGVVSSLKSPSAESAGNDPTERGTPTVSHLTPVLERSAQGTATPQAVPMTPLRQALTSNMNTPAGAETPTTYALTPAQTPSMGPSGSVALLDPIAEASATVVPSVTFSTPPRATQSAEISAVLVIAENQTEEQENEAAAQMQMEAWDAAQQRHQAAARAHASLAQDPYLVQHDGTRYGEGDAEEEEGELGEEDADDAEGLERELQRELEEHERELLAEREYEREEDREEEDDDDEDDEDDEEMDAEDELRERNRDNDDLDEAEEVNAHLVEMRRQAMIENLVNMGLPEEWAVRAAQQTDISRSETAAITWIIERMELEQSGHAGGMSQEEEDFDESEQDLDYFMNRNPAAFRLQRSESENSGTSGPAGGNMALSTHSQRLLAMQRGVNPIDGNNSSLSGGMSGLASGSGVSPGGSPTREEIYGLRRNLANVLAEDDAVSRGTTKGTSMGKVNVRGMSSWNNGGSTENKLFDEMAGATPWNADLSVPPVLIGQYVARRRHDQDKQEVLAQVVELDQADMLPIIIACEFSLCIYYARAVLLRSAAFIDHKFLTSDVDLENVAKNVTESKNNSDTASDIAPSEQKQIVSHPNGALNQLGMPLLASLLMHSSAEPLVIVELFKISFKQHVVGLTQPDRLFPLIANGNILGEARDRVPLISPFASANVNKLHSALARLELLLFHGSEGTLAVDESSMQGLDILSRMLDVAIYFSNEIPLPALPNSGSPLSITSNLRELQSQLLRNLGVSVDAEDLSWVDKFAAGCKVTLYNLVHEALECLQAATSAKYDSFDWILLSLDRHEKPAEPLVPPSSFKAEAASLLSQQQENAPAVAYAYWLLRSVLVKSEMYNLHAKSKSSTPKNEAATNGNNSGPSLPEAKSTGSDFSPNRAKGSPAGRSGNTSLSAMSAIDYLTSADTLAKLLKISATHNVSLRFCAHDLSALILSRVNVTLSATMAQNATETAEAGAPSPQIAASEYYITIAKEKRMLQMFGAHMKAEVQDRRMITRYTRSVGAFLFQWHLLRRQLGLSSVNYMHEYLMADLSVHTESTVDSNIAKPSAYSRTATSDLAEALTMSPQTLQRSQRKEASPEKIDPIWYGVRITQLTSNSVTVDWSLDPVKFPPRIKMPEFGLVDYTPTPATTHEANLYFTPASHMGLEAPVLVLSGLEQNGTFHIDDLDADTLYKITITKDNAMNTSSDQEDEGEDSELAAHQEITLAMQARSVALLSYFDNGAPISSPQKDSAVPTIAAHSPASSVEATPAPVVPGQVTDNKSGGTATAGAVDTMLAPYSPVSTTAGKSLAPFPALLDLQPHSARGTSADRSVARLKNSSGSANPIVKAGGELVRVEETELSTKDEVMMFISTESEAPFQFDLENMSPNLLVSPHSLTLLNQSNKKWSTARANVRLNSGVHRWDVHIDRCVSKNIFIGVAAREAHLNNYVGCDKHGWAFLANKAVWHNKGKSKTYGDLFRSGDTVTVILDLDEGTLSFNLNNKPMGVAVEGLVGPLYPAFSLYNEGDQLTVVKVRSAAGESGGAGSCAAEKILERIETFNNLLACVAESFKVESAADSTEVSCGNASSNDSPVSPAVNPATITEELGEELLQRWELWKAEIPMRSFLVGNDFVTICASAPQCHVLSRGLLQLWDSVILQKELAMVVGVGQHRLWFRTQATGALSGYTADSIQHMHEKGTLHRAMATREARVHCTANHIAPFEKSSHASAGLNTEFFGFELSATAMKEAISKLQLMWRASDDGVLVDYLNSSARKYASDPFNLHICHVISANSTENAMLHPLCATYTTEAVVLRALILIHFNDLALPLLPILCPFSSAFEGGPFFADALLLNKLSTEAAGNHPSSMMKTMRGLFFSQIKREFALHLTSSATNGTMTIVRPPLSSCSTITIGGAGRDSAPSSEKLGGRVLQSILQTLKEDTSKHALNKTVDSSPDDRTRQSPHHFPFITAGEGDLPLLTPFQAMTPSTALTHPNSVLAVTPADRSFFKFPVGDSPALTASTASLILPTGHCGLLTSTLEFVDVDPILVLEITDEATLAKHLYESAVRNDVQLQILLDERWKLLIGFQCSYVGQIMSYFEQVAGLNPNSAATLPETAANTKGARNKGLQSQLLQLQQGGNAAAWESCLKISTEGMGLLWPCDTLLAAQRSVPFIIRATKSQTGTADSMVPTKLFQWFQIAERNPERVSEWTLFAVFVEEACSQVRRVVESLFDAQDGHLVDSSLLCTDAAMLNLSLQLFHAAGVLVGLALRTGVPIYLPLPTSFYAVLANSSSADGSATSAAGEARVELASAATNMKLSQVSEDTAFALAMAVRTGVIATFPEPALDLLSYDEVRGLLTGDLGYGPPSALLLHRHATYEPPLCAENPHIMLFWAAMYELPTKNVQALLKQLMPPTTSPARVHQVLYGFKHSSFPQEVPFYLHILPPTAVAMLSPDVSEIVLFADRSALALPRYSNLKVMMDYLHRICAV